MTLAYHIADNSTVLHIHSKLEQAGRKIIKLRQDVLWTDITDIFPTLMDTIGKLHLIRSVTPMGWANIYQIRQKRGEPD